MRLKFTKNSSRIYTEYMRKKSTVTRWKKLLVAALAAGTIGGGVLAVSNINFIRGEKVVDVIDGDTFFIENHQRIRLSGVNAPELGLCMASDAKNALSSLILGKRVHLRSPVSDRYGRIMALVYHDKTFVNELMLRSGLSQYDGAGKNQREHLYQADIYARTNKIGIYSEACTQTASPNPTCLIKGNVNTSTNHKDYFLPSCGFYSAVIVYTFEGDAWFCTEAEAKKAGFTKSDTCN
jgi:endonuclease YncB( thermonuclease family)